MKKHQIVAVIDVEDRAGTATDLDTLSNTAIWLAVRLQSKALAVDPTVYASVADLVAAGDADKPPVFALVQEGGSSCEMYLHLHDSRDAAEQDRIDCANAGSYRTSRIVEVPASLADHPAFFGVVEALLQASTDFSYGEAE